METEKEKKLLRAWQDKNSPIYHSKKLKDLYDFSSRNDLNLNKKEIKRFLELRNSADVTYEHGNQKKISELSKSFVLRGKYFSQLHGDIMHLSKKFAYGSKLKYILLIVCALSKMTFVEPIYALKFEFMEKAFEVILKRIKEYVDFKEATFFSDGAQEFVNNNWRRLLKSHNIKLNIIGTRAYRLSIGSPLAESRIRHYRQSLETQYAEGLKMPFREMLRSAEHSLNNKSTMIGLTPMEIVNHHRPMEILSMTMSKRLKNRPYLRKRLKFEREINVGQVVRVRLMVKKQFSAKESYGRLSPFYVVTRIEKDRDMNYYRLSDIFTFKELSSSYSEAELKKVDLGLFEAIEKEQKRVKKIVNYVENDVVYECFYEGLLICANKSIIN